MYKFDFFVSVINALLKRSTDYDKMYIRTIWLQVTETCLFRIISDTSNVFPSGYYWLMDYCKLLFKGYCVINQQIICCYIRIRILYCPIVGPQGAKSLQ
jgi:hypothetical protein